jgi:hypothetical protein
MRCHHYFGLALRWCIISPFDAGSPALYVRSITKLLRAAAEYFTVPPEDDFAAFSRRSNAYRSIIATSLRRPCNISTLLIGQRIHYFITAPIRTLKYSLNIMSSYHNVSFIIATPGICYLSHQVSLYSAVVSVSGRIYSHHAFMHIGHFAFITWLPHGQIRVVT